MKRFAVLTLLLGLVALPLLAQNPTGTLAGRVTDGKETLPGVTVTITSPSMQGSRTAVSSVDGDYIFKFLPPGEYKVRFELQGFQTQDTSVKINAASSQKLDAVMPMTQVAEEVTVTGSYETISSASQASTTYEKSLIDRLPIGRDIPSYVAMTPGVSSGTNGYQISGAQSAENLYMVNGVVVNENIRGQATSLYIEDAVQETTTSTASISAEYGRFSGGVINTLTKSGGNEFHGSFRLGLTNQTWAEPTPKTVTRANTTNKQYEATLGGFFIKDRLWFFAAGRYVNTVGKAQTALTFIPYATGTKDTRYEAKLTASITANHRVVGSYIHRLTEQSGYGFGSIPFADVESTYTRQLPETLAAYNYTGVLSDSFFVEGQYSKRTLQFQNSGGLYQDIIKGTVVANSADWDYTYNSPIFCGVCGAERRDNEDILLKASLFLSSAAMGSHDLILGFDQYNDMRKSNNFQSGSGFNLDPESTIVAGRNLYPVVPNNSNFDVYGSFIEYYPIFFTSRGTAFKTKSVFVNDKWRLNDKLSFNIGVRYDKNDGTNGQAVKVAKDSKISPRVGLTFDPSGDGNWVFNAGFAKYVMGISNGVADSSSGAGTPAWFTYAYGGPDINTACDGATGAGCTNTHAVLAQVFAWFNAACDPAHPTQCGVNNTSLYYYSPDIPGQGTQIHGGLSSPSADEFTVGMTKRIGSKGIFRADYVHRTFSDFYVTRLDGTTGKTVINGSDVNIKLIQNAKGSGLERKYDAVMTSIGLRLSDRFNLGGSYTWSKLFGNVVGETTGSGPVALAQYEYPEYKAYKQYNPKGLLGTDVTHRARLYGTFDVISSKHNRLSASLLQNFTSGTPYGANGSINRPTPATPPPAGTYVTLPSTVTYWFTARDKWRTENITSTDIAFDYAFLIPALGTDIQFFLKPAVSNVFNEHKLTGFNTTTYNSSASRGLKSFNPYTDKPVECTQTQYVGSTWKCTSVGADNKPNTNWMKGPAWGTATTVANYQAPRTFTVALGVRF
jgi:hypothetical protein